MFSLPHFRSFDRGRVLLEKLTVSSSADKETHSTYRARIFVMVCRRVHHLSKQDAPSKHSVIVLGLERFRYHPQICPSLPNGLFHSGNRQNPV